MWTDPAQTQWRQIRIKMSRHSKIELGLTFGDPKDNDKGTGRQVENCMKRKLGAG